MKYTAIIPVRAGSVRLPNKNILPFGESNLLIHKIRQLKKIPAIDEIVVSSDSDVMLQMAIDEGAKTHKRPVEYADEKTKPFSEVAAYCAQHAGTGENIIWATCVCPLCDEKIIAQAIEKYEDLVLDKKQYDSVVSVKSFKEFLWDENKPLNYKPDFEHGNHIAVSSKELPDWQVVINGFYILPRVDMIRWKYFFGPNVYRMVISKNAAVDIDDAADFAVAEALYKYDKH